MLAATSNPILFRRLTPPNFTAPIADSKDVVIGDYDGDNDLDALVLQTSCSGCPDQDTLYRNEGNDAFANPNITVIPGQVTNDVTPKRQYGAAGGDLDGDGFDDVMPSGHASQSEPTRVRLLLNDQTGLFTDVANARIAGLSSIIGSGFGWDDVKFGDIDNDGDLDIALANRCSTTAGTCLANESSALIMNDAPLNPGFFTVVPGGLGDPASEVHHDALWCDLNNDDLPEILLSQDMRGAMAPLRVGFNQGGSPPTFADAVANLVPNPAVHAEHLGCRDFNGDGLMDVHVGVWARSDRDPADPGYREDQIFLNTSVDTNMDGFISLAEMRLDMVPSAEPGLLWSQGFDANT